MTAWNVVFLGIMVLGLAAAVYHVVSERYANGAIAAGAALLGLVVLLTEKAPAPGARPVPEGRRRSMPSLGPGGAGETERELWLSGGIIAGFAATIVMSMALVIAYVITGAIGSETGGRVDRWFWGLANNRLTDGIYDVPLAAFSINLLAGLGWALVYARFAESRLRGPGWWRGMAFSLAPWALSLVVFFPLVGAGFLGMGLNAGPLPAIGNLLLHLIYGASLGGIFAVPDVSSSSTRAGAQAARAENNGAAIGLVAGLSGGLAVGAILAAIFATDVNSGLNITLAAGGFGTVAGALIGPFLGLDWGSRHEPGG
jgi:hypothetical protein